MAPSLSSACERAGVAVADRYSLPVVARLLGVSKQTVRALTSDGTLPVLRITPRTAWVLADDLAAFLARSYRARPSDEVKV